MRNNTTLFHMGSAPTTCWIVCACLKLQMEKREGSCPDLLNHHVAGSVFPLRPVHAGTWQLSQSAPPNSNEGSVSPGYWWHVDTDIFVWGRRPRQTWATGIWPPSWRKSGKHILQKSKDCVACYSFNHLSAQEFLAIMFHVLESEEEEN